MIYSCLLYTSNSSKRIRYILVPLEFGKWQEQYLKMAFEQPGMIKTARLVKKKGDYYLYVNLQFKAAEQKDVMGYLGVLPKAPDRVDYMLLNRQKEILEEGSLVGVGENQDQRNTALAKEIVALVKTSQCQLVVYNPKIKGEFFAGGHVWQMPAVDYQQLLAKIEQRIGEEGLLEPIRVSPRGLFTTCPKCQHNSKKNLMTERLFVCNRCGYSGIAERLGLYNLAAKLLTYENKALVFHLTKQKERLIIRNLRLGVEFITNVDVFYLKRFVIFLEEEYQRGMRVIAGEEKYYGEDYKQKYLLWRKLAALKKNNDSIEDYIVIEN